jgi:hypothetical protein
MCADILTKDFIRVHPMDLKRVCTSITGLAEDIGIPADLVTDGAAELQPHPVGLTFVNYVETCASDTRERTAVHAENEAETSIRGTKEEVETQMVTKGAPPTLGFRLHPSVKLCVVI